MPTPENQTYLSEQGWSVELTPGEDWGEVLLLSPQGEVGLRIAITDASNRATWPPSHLPEVVLAPGSWPWSDQTPHFSVTHEGKETFWWRLREDQRLAFGFHPPRKLDYTEEEPLRDLMAQQELGWALSALEHSQNPQHLRTALAILLQQRYHDALPLLLQLRERWKPVDTRAALVPPHPELCPLEGLIKLALWKLHDQAGRPLPDPCGSSAEQVYERAGPPDHIGWWRTDDRQEQGEFWDYYQPGHKVLRILWMPDHQGDKIRHCSREEIWPYWLAFRADQLVSGWLENRYGPSLHRDFPPASEDQSAPIVVELTEVKAVEIFAYRLNLFPIPSEKLVLTGPFPPGGPIENLLRALESPHLEPSPQQFGWSRPRLQVEFSFGCTDDHPSFLVRLQLSSDRMLQVMTTSYHSHMLPWSCRLDGSEIVKSYHRDISLAVAELLPEDFLDRRRLLDFDLFLGPFHDSPIPFEQQLSTYQRQPIPTDPNALDENQKTALMRASRLEAEFQALVKSGADLEVRGHQGMTGLQMACLWEGPPEVERWLGHGASLETRGESGRSALMLCANKPAMIKLLLAHGALVDAVDANGDSALDHAVRAQNLESIEILLNAGARSTRAHEHDLRCLAQAELEREREHAYREFHAKRKPRSLPQTQATLAELKAKYPQYSWAREPSELSLAREVLSKVEGQSFKSRLSALWARQRDFDP